MCSSFLGSPANPKVREELAELIRDAHLFDENRIVFYGVLTAPPSDPAHYVALNTPAISFIADYDGAISRAFGAAAMPRTIVLDPMLRAVADIPWDYAAGHVQSVRGVLDSLPAVDDCAGVPLFAPVLVVPRVLDFHSATSSLSSTTNSAAMIPAFSSTPPARPRPWSITGSSAATTSASLHPEVRDAIRSQIVRRLLPAIERFFQFSATRMDRYIVACYDSAVGGHFYRHRDNVNAGAQHRRFAVTINLNNDYDGCDLTFPEFGSRTYRAPHGGAIVFSCGALHQVTPVTPRPPLCLPRLPLWRSRRGAAREKQRKAPAKRIPL